MYLHTIIAMRASLLYNVIAPFLNMEVEMLPRPLTSNLALYSKPNYKIATDDRHAIGCFRTVDHSRLTASTILLLLLLFFYLFLFCFGNGQVHHMYTHHTCKTIGNFQ